MTALRSIAGLSTPPIHPVASAAHAVERAWHAMREAEDDWRATQVGDTDALFVTQAAWTAAIVEYERLRARLAVEIKRRDGVRWLRVARSGT